MCFGQNDTSILLTTQRDQSSMLYTHIGMAYSAMVYPSTVDVSTVVSVLMPYLFIADWLLSVSLHVMPR